MNIYFEDKELDTYNDDVIYEWYMSSSHGDYRLVMRFCGAINENEEENIDLSSFCNISLNECTSNDSCFIESIKKRVEDELSIEFETYEATVMICAPDIRREIYIDDEYGVDNSIKIAKSILHAAADVLGNDTDIDIDNLIDDAFIEVVTE